MSRRRNPPRNKKRKMDSGVDESEEEKHEEDEELFNPLPELATLDQLYQYYWAEVRSSEADELNPLGFDPTTNNEPAGLSASTDLAEDGEFNESLKYWFPKNVPTDGERDTTSDHEGNTLVEPTVESRRELEQLFRDIFYQRIQGTSAQNIESQLDELCRRLPRFARTHVNTLIGHMLDWIERQRNNIQNDAPVLAPMERDSNIKVRDDDPTLYSHGVRVGRGPYKCHWCGKLKKFCSCKLADNGSGEFEDSKKRKFTIRPIDNVEEKIKASIERGLEFLKTVPLEDCSDSEGTKADGYLCNLCGYSKLPKGEHRSRCILGPGECFKMGEDGKTVFKVEEKGARKRTREEKSDGDGEERDGSIKNECNTSDDNADERKPAAVLLQTEQTLGSNSHGDHMDGVDRSDENQSEDGGPEFEGIRRYEV